MLLVALSIAGVVTLTLLTFGSEQNVFAMSMTKTTSIGSTASVISSVDFDSLNGEIYVASIDGKMRIVDASTDTIKQTVDVSGMAFDIAKNPSIGMIYLSLHYLDKVLVLDSNKQ